MGKVYPEIDARLRDFIVAQPIFFVATAPVRREGHVNVSPKGMRGTFVMLGPHRVAYLDYHGSGAETIAHLRDNGRITLMFCAFDGPPKIVRLHGRGAASRSPRTPSPHGSPSFPHRRTCTPSVRSSPSRWSGSATPAATRCH